MDDSCLRNSKILFELYHKVGCRSYKKWFEKEMKQRSALEN